MTQSNMPSRNLATGEGEPIQRRRPSRHGEAEIDLMRKNASEIYEIVFSADFGENPREKQMTAAVNRSGASFRQDRSRRCVTAADAINGSHDEN